MKEVTRSDNAIHFAGAVFVSLGVMGAMGIALAVLLTGKCGRGR